MANKCKECGCMCKQCNNYEPRHNDMHLHAEIENLRRCLVEKNSHIVTMETHFINEAKKFPNGELASMQEEMLIWQEKYARLHEAHKRVQKVNQNLEDKLLKIVDKCETEKGAFTKDIATLSHRLADANYTIHRLTQDNEKYRNDVNLAIQLLQCKPSNFVAQKYESLPPEVQTKVRTYVAPKGRNNKMPNTEVKSITVPISTFPPTAMVYSIAKSVDDKQENNSDDDSKPPIDTVSAAIMAKVLEDREKERIFAHHCNTCTCHRNILKIDTGTQTIPDQETSSLGSTKDYFNKLGSNEIKNTKYDKDSSQSELKKVREINKKGYSPFNDLNAKRTNIYCVNEAIETNHHVKDNTKVLKKSTLDAKNYLNLKNSSRLQNEGNSNDKSKTLNEGSEVKMKDSFNKKKLSSEAPSLKEKKHFDDQAKLDIINERLWKSSWMNSQTSLNSKENEVKLDVINDRVWTNSSKCLDKTTPITVIEVKSSDDFTNSSEKMPTEPTTSPSFSSDSIVISSSDPSSLASDVISNQIPSNSNVKTKTETSSSKNILLDNIGAYQTVLYTSGHNKPNTALVHTNKSSRSNRSISISSEDNEKVASSHEIPHLQRVAQWVDTLSNDCDSQSTAQPLDVCLEEPLLNSHKLADNKIKTHFENQKDLMIFEGYSDEEHKLTADYDYQANISKEMEETYLKLAASLDSPSSRLTNSPDIDLMTIEKYRKEQKRLYKGSQVKFQPKT